MEGVGRRGKWHEKAPLGTLLLLCMLGLTLPQSAEEKECPAGEYPTENGICCNKCPAGFKLGADCQAERERSQCLPCAKGEYTDQINYSPTCRSCKRCKKFEEEVSPCASYRNTICRCKDGFYKRVIDSDTNECLKCTSCGAGERQTEKCTLEHNTKCECEKDYYRIKKKCLPCKNCTADCQRHCPLHVTKPPENEKGFLTIAVVGVGVLGLVVVVLVGFITYKSRKKSAKKMLQSPSPPYNVSQESTEILMQTSESSENNCNRSVPLSPVSEQEPSNLPDCVPLEIKIPDMIYAVLDLVPVQQVKQLVRSLGVTDMEIERAETDHRVCKEAHYQMLRVWAERASQAGGGGRGRMLHRPLLQELLDTLGKMHLGQAVEELETKYGIQ
ncbi:tumor necrosis factor receptor superfamily member 1A [Centroberyx gerrardi]